MPRLRQPTAKKEELFDSDAATPAVEEQEKPVQEAAVTETPKPFELQQEAPPAPVVEEPRIDDAAAALKKQIDEIRRSEALQREQVDAQWKQKFDRMGAEQAIKDISNQRDRLKSERMALEGSHSAAKATVEKALSDLRNAENSGDTDSKIEATGRLVSAQGDMGKFEAGIAEIQAKRRELRDERDKLRKAVPDQQQAQVQSQQPQQPQRKTVEELAASLPVAEAEWLRQHRDYVEDPTKFSRLSSASQVAYNEGLQVGNPAYIPRVEEVMEFLNGGGRAAPEPVKRSPPVSAPVSREVPSASGARAQSKVTLTAAQREAAKDSGVTEAEYARQLVKYQQMVADGTYGGHR